MCMGVFYLYSFSRHTMVHDDFISHLKGIVNKTYASI